ncbi:ABC transporter substrate-binding protein [Microbispora rosea subsp. aerata]|nr:ABC transporter substrate-binding protein [Microbispora rosea]GGO27962.1 ABC transporter substrate-binding protein [Microbispora rosea subsp. aerata]GIH56987.1 ABC transporter substrate-binding protein [Microbispora rosea subsp. aerata]GLJ82914.1 ABC transporter substrate-binding protein [Microbispora rosea subsp. aerata]
MTIRACAVTISSAAILLSAVSACSKPSSPDKPLPPLNPRADSLESGFGTMDRLVEAARKEGALTVVGLPGGWVGYKEIIARFSDKYGIKVTSLAPEASSKQEIDTAARLKGTDRAPDVFDLTLEVAVANAKLFAPYRVQGWADIPGDIKDQRGRWYAAYGGYMSIGYDPRKVPAPTSYGALVKPGTTVALPGDPRQVASAFDAVMAASLGRGLPDAARGVNLFARLKKGGMLGRPDQAAVVVDWDFMNAARAAAGRGESEWRVTIPKNEVFASYYMQAINANAPHPAAARLWEEFLLSDEGQNLFLKAFARPARFEAMEMRGTLDGDAAARLPEASGDPVMLSIPEQDKAKSYVAANWARLVG